MIEPAGPHDPDGIVIRELLASCPSFWGPLAAAGDRVGPYIDAGVFAQHLVDCLERGATSEFPFVFEAVERLLTTGDEGVRYVVTFGLIEDIQNIASNRYDWPFAARFRPWLGRRTAAAWDDVHRVWGTSDC